MGGEDGNFLGRRWEECNNVRRRWETMRMGGEDGNFLG
jgi:hypothetical protein